MALANRRRRRLAMQLAERGGHETVVIPAIDQPQARVARRRVISPLRTRPASATEHDGTSAANRGVPLDAENRSVPRAADLHRARRREVRGATRLVRSGPRSRRRAARATILVIKFWGMGSIVLTTPALRALKKTYPDCRVTFLTFEQNESVCRMITSIDRVRAYRADGVVAFLASFVDLRRASCAESGSTSSIDLEFFANFTSIVTAISGAPHHGGFSHAEVLAGQLLHASACRFDHTHITEIFLKAARPWGPKRTAISSTGWWWTDGAAGASLDRISRRTRRGGHGSADLHQHQRQLARLQTAMAPRRPTAS